MTASYLSVLSHNDISCFFYEKQEISLYVTYNDNKDIQSFISANLELSSKRCSPAFCFCATRCMHVLPRHTKPHRCTCTRFWTAQREQHCAVSSTCSISCQASLSSTEVQTVLVPPQWYSTCLLGCTHPCCLPPV